jgi:hypothetical protein
METSNKSIGDLIKSLKHLDVGLAKVTSTQNAGGISITEFERETINILMKIVDSRYSNLVETVDNIKHNK